VLDFGIRNAEAGSSILPASTNFSRFPKQYAQLGSVTMCRQWVKRGLFAFSIPARFPLNG